MSNSEELCTCTASRASARIAATCTVHVHKHKSPSVTGQRCQEACPASDDAEGRAAIRRAGAEDARRSRARQGLPERIEDPAAVAVLAAILRDTPAPPRASARDPPAA